MAVFDANLNYEPAAQHPYKTARQTLDRMEQEEGFLQEPQHSKNRCG